MKGEFSNKEKRKRSPLVGVEYPLDEEVAGGLSQDTLPTSSPLWGQTASCVSFFGSS